VEICLVVKKISEQRKKDNISKSNVGRHFSQISFLYGIFEKIFERKLRGKGLKTLLPQKGETILDVGTGTGCSLLEISCAVGGLGKAFGIDISEKMLLLSKKRANQKKRTYLLRADATNLPFRDGFFDGVYVMGTLDAYNPDEINFCLEEFKRVLKPEGRLVVGSLDKKNKPPFLFRFYDFLQSFFPNHFISKPIEVEKLIIKSGYKIKRKEDILVRGIFPMKIIRAKTRK